MLLGLTFVQTLRCMKIKASALYISRHIVWKRAFSVLTVLMLLVAGSCKDDDAKPAQASGCRLVLVTRTSNTRVSETLTYTSTGGIASTYDDKGNETGTTVSYDDTYSDGTTSTYSGTITRQYDDEGFMLRVINKSTRMERDKSTSFNNSDTRYTYENGRLIKSITESSYNTGAGQTSTYVYDYDSDGNLIRFTNLSANEVTKIEYIGKKVVKVTRVDAKGVETTPFFEYDGSGRLVKWVEPHSSYTEEYRYEYDTNGQVARRERYIDGKAYSADVTEYDTRQSPYSNNSSYPKGHPIVPSSYAVPDQKNNTVRGMYYDGDEAGTGWKIRASSISVYDYNASGFPVSSTEKNFDGNGVETYSGNAVYAYEGCN
jgi:YD repeat-containing protein